MTLKSFVASLLIAVAIAPSIAAAPPIRIDSRQLTGSAPAYFRIRLTLEPDERNRWVCLRWHQTTGGQQEKTSCWSVQAEQEARTTWKELKELPAGKYAVVAYVVRNDEQAQLSNTLSLTVIGIGYEPEE